MNESGTRLSAAALAGFPGNVAVPAYDRSGLRAGILHIGVGNFHRAHQAVYLDDLFNSGRDHDWAILGAGVMPGDTAMRERLVSQDLLTTVVEQSALDSSARVIGPMIGFLGIGDGPAILDALSEPDLRIVSLTITEGGYYIDAASGAFDAAHPDICADAASPGSPKTVFGLIAAALRQRHERNIAPFAVMSCDNIPHNGAVARRAVVGLAELHDPAFAAWINDNVTFPNGMVDRITPVTGERERRELHDRFGVDDACPVFCEDFRQWVLEDTFPQGRPALETVGVQFVPDVTPFEQMKIRILNGGHALIAYPAALLDLQFGHEAMNHPLIRSFMHKVEREEIIPTLEPIPGNDFAGYLAQVSERFANPRIGDTIQRLCLDGSNRQPKFIVPSIADRLRQGEDVTGLALGSALWCRYCYGQDEAGHEIAPNDPNWERLNSAARAARSTPDRWLAMDDIYREVSQSRAFREAFAQALDAIWSEGTQAVLGRYVEPADATAGGASRAWS
jgi:mannitol 2-dehydrogenase